ncbi:hypothetical protein DEO72_LG5g970 [Vigna unguiculata]|uniref:Uncharacterized protein n=1 Tax=Vigna unguiculata TaxID=3917 RepID=A0A4D6LWW9_VIGUN|nr:hypothetical protein DEO72_LG5g970 [Vigna unguiculata]
MVVTKDLCAFPFEKEGNINKARRNKIRTSNAFMSKCKRVSRFNLVASLKNNVFMNKFVEAMLRRSSPAPALSLTRSTGNTICSCVLCTRSSPYTSRYGSDTTPGDGIRPSGHSDQFREALDLWRMAEKDIPPGDTCRQWAVSYTHLDVYKRQNQYCAGSDTTPGDGIRPSGHSDQFREALDLWRMAEKDIPPGDTCRQWAVSYTHLDVYKRQNQYCAGSDTTPGDGIRPSGHSDQFREALDLWRMAEKDIPPGDTCRQWAVSYTHLDVYKRQNQYCAGSDTTPGDGIRPSGHSDQFREALDLWRMAEKDIPPGDTCRQWAVSYTHLDVYKRQNQYCAGSDTTPGDGIRPSGHSDQFREALDLWRMAEKDIPPGDTCRQWAVSYTHLDVYKRQNQYCAGSDTTPGDGIRPSGHSDQFREALDLWRMAEKDIPPGDTCRQWAVSYTHLDVYKRQNQYCAGSDTTPGDGIRPSGHSDQFREALDLWRMAEKDIPPGDTCRQWAVSYTHLDVYKRQNQYCAGSDTTPGDGIRPSGHSDQFREALDLWRMAEKDIPPGDTCRQWAVSYTHLDVYKRQNQYCAGSDTTPGDGIRPSGHSDQFREALDLWRMAEKDIPPGDTCRQWAVSYTHLDVYKRQNQYCAGSDTTPGDGIRPSGHSDQFREALDLWRMAEKDIPPGDTCRQWAVSYTHLDVYKRQNQYCAGSDTTPGDGIRPSGHSDQFREALDLWRMAEKDIPPGDTCRQWAVSYTHLDVYKRQNQYCAGSDTTPGDGIRPSGHSDQFREALDLWRMAEKDIPPGDTCRQWAVSYTHLDVYKRQNQYCAGSDTTPGDDGHNHVIRVLHLLVSTSRCLAVTPTGHNQESTCGKLCYESNTTRRTSHNSHTHTGNTRQPEPQLKSSSCSSTIPSNNSRDAIPSHNSRNITCLIPIPSHNSRDTFRATTQGTPTSARRPTLLDHLAGDVYCQAQSASGAHCLHVSPGGMSFTAKRHTSSASLNWSLSPDGLIPSPGVVSEPAQYWFRINQTCFHPSFDTSRLIIHYPLYWYYLSSGQSIIKSPTSIYVQPPKCTKNYASLRSTLFL